MDMMERFLRLPIAAMLALGAAIPLTPAPAAAQFVTLHEQTYLPASHNWVFRRNYSGVDRLFNAFDYGHAILYETLHARSDAPVSLLEEEIYNRLTRRVLVQPPRLPLAESAIAIRYAQLAPEALAMFHWAHVLHRQSYDILADERLSMAEKDAAMAELLRYYRSRPDLAFSTQPKSMDIMDGQHYSLAFRERFPKFNGLIWAYHWLQIGLYEPMLAGTTGDERQALVKATVARFWQMLDSPPDRMPYLMPMTAAVAPRFAERYPEIAIVFDNLHMMHDVVSDILASEQVPRRNRRAEIMRAVAMFRDDTSYATTREEWRRMAVGMGVHNQGGPSVGFLQELPTPTVRRGQSMAGMDHADGEHEHGEPAPAQETAPHRPAEDPHAGHGMDHDHSPAGHQHGTAADSAAVVDVVNRFHQALASGDSAAALALLAADAVVHESGKLETRAEYRSHHLPADIAFARAVHSERGPMAVRISGDIAWASSTSRMHGTFRGREIDSSGAELMVLSREGSGWRIRAISWSAR